MKYLVTIIETNRHSIEIRAKDQESAIEKAQAKFEKDPEKGFESEQDFHTEVEEIE